VADFRAVFNVCLAIRGGSSNSHKEAGERHRTEDTQEMEDTEGLESTVPGEAKWKPVHDRGAAVPRVKTSKVLRSL
jgi:hypothetical protein